MTNSKFAKTKEPVEKQRLSSIAPGILQEIGTSGLKRSGGHVYEEWLRELRGDLAMRTYREMADNEAIIYAALQGICSIIKNLNYTAKPTDDQDPAALEAAEFVEGCMEDMSLSWEQTLSEALSMLIYGWSWLLIVYKRRLGPSDDGRRNSRFTDGLLGWRKWAIRGQESRDHWKFDDSGSVIAMVQRDPQSFTSVRLPLDRSILFRTTIHKDNPEGKSLLRGAYIPYYRKRHYSEIESIGLERELAGLPIAWIPAELLSKTSTAEQQSIVSEIKDMLANVRVDEQAYVLMPQEFDESGNKRYDFALVSSAGSRAFDTNIMIKRQNAEMAMALLFDLILLGHERVGSLALSQSKMELTTLGIESITSQLLAPINRHAIPWLWRLNGLDPQVMPQIIHSPVEFIDVESMAKYLQALAGSGMPLFPDPKLENRLRAFGGLPDRPEDLEAMSEPIEEEVEVEEEEI